MNQDIKDILYTIDDMKKQIQEIHSVIVGVSKEREPNKKKRSRSPSRSPVRRRPTNDNTLALFGIALEKFNEKDLSAIFSQYGSLLNCKSPWKVPRSSVWMSKITFETQEACDKCLRDKGRILQDYKIDIRLNTK